MSKKSFAACKDVTIINQNEVVKGSNESLSVQLEMLNLFLSETNIKNPQYTPLKIPRRPPWTEKMSANEINN